MSSAHFTRLPDLMAASVAVLTLFASPVHAQDTPDENASATVDANAASENPPEQEREKKKRDLLIVPLPLSSPSMGTGLAVGAIAFYNPNNAPNQWITGVGAAYTSHGTSAVAAFHSMSLNQDQYRISVIASYGKSKEEYFGIGEEAGNRGDSIDLTSKELDIQLQGLRRVFSHGYLGARYHLTTVNAEPSDDPEDLPALPVPPPADQMDSTLSAIGPMFVYDTRDSATQPHKGVYVSALWMFGMKALGDSFNHNKLTVIANGYQRVSPKDVLAFRAQFCATDGEVPYYDLCKFGSGPDLRGYESGRYRDGASWSTQGELRHHFGGRWGGVAFWGIGGIAPSASDILKEGNLLPAGGFGVRYQPFRNNDVNLRLDVAFGKNDHGVYLGVIEVF